MVHVLGVSMPRSGHQLLEMLLRNILQDEFDYCEFYYAKDCCKSIPCISKAHQKSRTTGLFLQKSHDFNLTDPVVVPGAYRVVQYRSPVPRSLSNYELHLRDAGTDSIRTFRNFLVYEAWYFRSFYKKWIEPRSNELFLLTYEELTADPLKAILAFFRYIKLPVGPERISRGIAQAIRNRATYNTRFAPPEVMSHRYAKHPVLANFEDIVIRTCPGYHPMRYFSVADSDNSLIGIILKAKEAIEAADFDTATMLAESAYAQDPSDPQLANLVATARAVKSTPRTSSKQKFDSIAELSSGITLGQ